MKNRILFITAISVMALIVLAACGSATPTAAPTTTSGGTTTLDGQSIMQTVCTQCHSLAPIYNTQTDEAGWTQIVDNMISRGAVLSPEEKTVLIQYLAANY